MSERLAERRKYPRLRSYLGATLRIQSGSSATHCLVRDIAEDGAKLHLGDTIPLPDIFDLTITHREEVRAARLVWRRNDRVGVAFVRPPGRAVVIPFDTMRDLRATKSENAALRTRIASLETSG